MKKAFRRLSAIVLLVIGCSLASQACPRDQVLRAAAGEFRISLADLQAADQRGLVRITCISTGEGSSTWEVVYDGGSSLVILEEVL